MIVQWKLELAGSKDIITGTTEIEDDDDPFPDDYIDEKVREDALQFVQITWERT